MMGPRLDMWLRSAEYDALIGSIIGAFVGSRGLL